MARVSLVNLPFQANVAAVAQTSVGPPLGLAYIAAVLEQTGHQVRIIDANALGLSLAEVIVELGIMEPQIVGTTAATPSIGLAEELARMCKHSFAGIKVVVGGPHTTALPRETLESCPDIDIAVAGEGEPIAHELMTALAAGDDGLADIPCIAWRDQGQVCLNSSLPRQQGLDAVPFPARHLLPNQLYRTIDAWPMTCIMAMRGCPAGCVYCNVPEIAGKQVRRRSPQNVVAELSDTVHRYNVHFFSFLDDTFTTSRSWVLEFCETMQTSGMAAQAKWSCLTRPDMVDEELLRLMKAAGLMRVEFGIESGSPRVLEFLNKGAGLPQIRTAFKTARKVGLATLGFAMINTPEETPADMDMTLQEVLSIDPDFLQLSFCTPYPGTNLHDYCVEHDLIIPARWSDYRFLKTPIIKNRWLSPEEVAARHRDILRRFYLRPSKALRLATIAITSPNTAYSLARSSLQGLSHLVRRFR